MKKFFIGSSLLALLMGSTLLAEEAKPSEIKEERTFSAEETQKIDTFLSTVQKRLDLMEELSKHKWNNTLPIEDDAALKETERHIQIEHFEKWVQLDHHKVETDVDFENEILPRLEELNDALIAQMEEIKPLMEKEEIRNLFAKRADELLANHDVAVRETLIASFLLQK